jgi:hypothetical protein
MCNLMQGAGHNRTLCNAIERRRCVGYEPKQNCSRSYKYSTESGYKRIILLC